MILISRAGHIVKVELTIPQFRIDAIQIQQFVVRPGLGHLPILQHQDLVAVVDGAQPVGHEHAGAALLLKNTVDVLEERLLRVRV